MPWTCCVVLSGGKISYYAANSDVYIYLGMHLNGDLQTSICTQYETCQRSITVTKVYLLHVCICT